MKESMFDIAIAGGGLAGLCTAIQAADAGYKVILFEKENYPFHKVCGEYIAMESWNFLTRMGVPLGEWQLPRISELNISDPKGRQYTFDISPGGFGISRYKLDHSLYQIALKKGVEIQTGSRVKDIRFHNEVFSVIPSGEPVKARLVLGAYGKRSLLDKMWNRPFFTHRGGKLNNYVGIKYHIDYPQQPDQISLHNFKDGYCGISQIENNTCCLCYLTTTRNLQLCNNSIREMERKILWLNPHLKKIFTEASFVFEQPMAISQVSFFEKTRLEDHVLLAGDAAGLITPLCGNGMSMAMHASKLAFENMDDFLQGNITRSRMEQNYNRQWEGRFASRLQTGRRVQKLFGRNSTTALFLRTMGLFPFFAAQLIKNTHGESF